MPSLPPNKPTTHLLLAALFATGCTSPPEPVSADLRQQLGKVYLSSAGATGETFFNADFEPGGTGGAIRGAGKGALEGLDSCLNNSLSSGVLAPFVLLICTPMVMPGAIAKGSSTGSVPAVEASTLAELEQQTNTVLQNADLSPAMVATLDEIGQKNAYLAQYEISHGTLPLPGQNESIHNVAAQWGYQTVMEIEVTRAGLESDDAKVPMMHFFMTTQVRLVEAQSGKQLLQQEYDYSSSPQPYALWFNNDYRNLGKEIAKANRTIANDIIGNIFTK